MTDLRKTINDEMVRKLMVQVDRQLDEAVQGTIDQRMQSVLREQMQQITVPLLREAIDRLQKTQDNNE